MRRMVVVLALLGLIGCGHAPLQTPSAASANLGEVDWAKASTVAVTLDDFSFEPRALSFDGRSPYRLRIENKGSGGHNFDAPDFFKTTVLRDGEAADRVRASGGVVELKIGEAVDLFLVPIGRGRYPLECSHTLHASFGMTGSITVR